MKARVETVDEVCGLFVYIVPGCEPELPGKSKLFLIFTARFTENVGLYTCLYVFSVIMNRETVEKQSVLMERTKSSSPGNVADAR